MKARSSYLLTDLTGGVNLTPVRNVELASLAREVERLAPSHRDPHAFHEAKSEIVHKLRCLAEGITPSKDGKLGSSTPVGNTHMQLVDEWPSKHKVR